VPRSFGLYLILVGLPALGTSLVLRAGKSLRAPASFAGSWQVEATPESACRRALQLTIEQSGPVLEVRTPEGNRLLGQVRNDSFEVAGSDGRRIRARQRPARPVSEWEGLAKGLPCDSPGALPVRATRVGLPREVRGH
jgi:hypothetical protein